ncbi:elongation factor G [bacterium]|nr:elongation factor G [bacterium]
MPRDCALEKLRNIGIIAHIDAGKTTTTERILFFSGKTYKIGNVQDGQAVMDWMEQEKERGITITSAATTCNWKGHQINIIDTPGHVDFTIEVERSLRVLDGACVILDSKQGVEPQTETVWRQADRYKVPRMFFCNKVNLLGSDFFGSVKSIREKLTSNAYIITFPYGEHEFHKGIIDVIKMKAYLYQDDTHLVFEESEIPEDILEKTKALRAELIEKIVEFDESLMEKYLSGEELSEEEITVLIRKGTVSGLLFPVLGGDGRSVVVTKILDAIVNYLPSPVDVPNIKGTDPKTNEEIFRHTSDDEKFSAIVFKIATDPFVGKLAFFRIYSGKLEAGSYVYNSVTGKKERVGRIVRMHANSRSEVSDIYAGDIAAIVGLKNVTTGHTICDESAPVLLESMDFPDPVIDIAVEPKSKADQEKMGIALGKLLEEDPSFRVETKEETGQTIISGMGELHLEIIIDRMKREFNVELNIGKPQVAYKETITTEAKAEGKYIHQSGGRGQYGHCWLRVQPFTSGEEKSFEFKDEIKGGVIPREYVPAIEKGVKESMTNGPVAGYPMVDISVAVYDGSFHEVDSSEAAFKIAASHAFREACRNAKPILLEPIMKVEVVTAEEYMGDIIGDLNSRRGKIQDMYDRANLKVVDAMVPLGSMFGYATSLRSMSQGRATYTMEFNKYEEVPKNIVEEMNSSK